MNGCRIIIVLVKIRNGHITIVNKAIQDIHCTINITPKSVRVTIVAVLELEVLHVPSLCL
jgi:hypothetical protein